jgi:purine-binding chemotaxis protein CheW
MARRKTALVESMQDSERARATALGRGKRDNSPSILRERARRLAKPIENPPDRPAICAVVVAVGDQRFAIETRFVLAAFPLPAVVAVPRAAPQLRGLSLVRGHLLPVFDLAELLGWRSHEKANGALIAILGTAQPEIGLLVNEAFPATSIAVDDITEPDSDSGSTGFVTGVLGDGTTLLDGQLLLNHPALFL